MEGIAYQTGSGAKEERETFMSPLNEAHVRVNEVQNRLLQLEERLVGLVPTQAEPSQIRGVPIGPAGLLGEVADGSRDMRDKLDNCLDMISRIERALP